MEADLAVEGVLVEFGQLQESKHERMAGSVVRRVISTSRVGAPTQKHVWTHTHTHTQVPMCMVCLKLDETEFRAADG